MQEKVKVTAQARIEELRELLAKVTPRPWGTLCGDLIGGENEDILEECDDLYGSPGKWAREEDKDFVLALVNDAEALLEIAETLDDAEGFIRVSYESGQSVSPSLFLGVANAMRAALAKLAGGSE